MLSKFGQTVHTIFHAKSGLCSLKNEPVMLNFEIWWPFCFLPAILFFKFFSKFVRTVAENISNDKSIYENVINYVWGAFPTLTDGNLVSLALGVASLAVAVIGWSVFCITRVCSRDDETEGACCTVACCTPENPCYFCCWTIYGGECDPTS